MVCVAPCCRRRAGNLTYWQNFAIRSQRARFAVARRAGVSLAGILATLWLGCNRDEKVTADCRPRAATFRPSPRSRVSLFDLSADRADLPPSSHLLGLWRGGNRALRSVGRRMDDARTHLPLPPVRDVGIRRCPGAPAGSCPLVRAVALRTVGVDERPRRPGGRRAQPINVRLPPPSAQRTSWANWPRR